MKKNQIDIVTMGCSKNLVDSETLMKLFEDNGYHCVHDPKRPQGEIAVINTCGFIEDAKQESIDTILEFIQAKEEGRLRKLYVMGCLSQRYQKELEAEMPEVDKFYGKFNYKELLKELGKADVPACSGTRHLTTPHHYAYIKISEGCNRRCAYCAIPIITGKHVSRPMDEILDEVRQLVADGVKEFQIIAQELTYYGVDLDGKHHITELISRMADIPGVKWIRLHYAYIKISEGCDRRCAYCAIPLITGKHISRPKEDILNEVRELVADGVKEFQIIAQELTYYGMDIDGKHHITDLVSDMADIPGVKWIRLHYAYPNQFPLDLLDVMREKPNVCKYLDIALQHISDHMLTRMHRHVTKQETLDLLTIIRNRVPGIHIRTTLMVGFPGETDEDFHELLDFVREQRFERMGAFAYSEEEGTYSAQNYEDDVPADVKQRRLDELMILQQDISAEIEANKVGLTLPVVIDRKEGDYYIGRTEFCSPEVDPEVLIKADQRLRVGTFYKVKITSSEEFDLYGEVVK